MAWNTVTHLSEGNIGSCGILDMRWSFAISGWDTGSIEIAHQGDVSVAFQKGDAFPTVRGKTVPGLYVSDIDTGGVWRGNVNKSSVRFLGFVGGVNGMVMRMEEEGAHRTERLVTAREYYNGNTPEYGTKDRPLLKVPGGVVDAIRFVSMQPYSSRQFISSIGPPSIYSLEVLRIGSKVIRISPTQSSESQIGSQLIYNFPNGMLASSVRYVHHPAPSVDLWLVDITWEAVAERDVA